MLIKVANSQQFPIYTQHMGNPYVINPGFVAISGRPEINLSYRQQWAGIDDGPRTIQADGQLPIGKKISLGLNIINDRSIILSQFTGFATFGYRIPLSSKQQLSFGLSAGIISNQLQLDEIPDVDLIDPVLKDATNNIDFDGQFGIGYTYGKLSIGFSLLKLVNGKPFYNGETLSEYEFDPFKDKAGFISYQFNLGGSVSFQPYFMYRSTFTGSEYFEGIGIFTLSKKFSVGGGYRSEWGPIAMIRFKINKAQIGYSYDFPTNKYGGSTQGTNEVQFKWMFGDEPQELIITENKETTAENKIASAEDTNLDEKENEDAMTPIVQNEQTLQNVAVVVSQPISSEPTIERSENLSPQTSADTQSEPAKWYLIVGTFEKKSNAERLARALEKEGVIAEIKHFENYYYVHIPEHAAEEITVDKVLEIRKTTPHTDAWFKKLD